MNRLRVTVCALVFGLTGVSAATAQNYNYRPYVGIEGTSDKGHYPAIEGLGTTTGGPENSLRGQSVFVGARVTPTFGLELGYGTSGSTSRTDSASGITSTVDVRDRLTFDLMGYSPLGRPGLELIGLIGASRSRLNLSVTDGNNTDTSTGTSSGGHIGVGAQMLIASRIGLRGIVEREMNMVHQDGAGSHRYNGWALKVGALYQF